jgi:hypothetical protein
LGREPTIITNNPEIGISNTDVTSLFQATCRFLPAQQTIVLVCGFAVSVSGRTITNFRALGSHSKLQKPAGAGAGEIITGI